MKRLLLVLAFLLGGSIAFAQSGGSSAAGGGLSTKAILALEECFDDFDTFICTGGGGSGTVGPGTVNRIAKFTAATTVDDSLLNDDGTNLSGSYGGTIGLSSTGDMTLTTSDQMFLTATTDINIPDDVELIFGTTATVGAPATIEWNTFSGAGFERLEIVGGGNAGVLVQHGGTGGTGSFVVADNEGSLVHTFTQNAPPPAGDSRPSWIFAVTAPSSMDDAADQRAGVQIDMESGTTDVAGSQQVALFIDPIVARASTQDQIILGTGGWDNNIVFGSETVRTALNFATPSGANVVTVPAATGTILLDTDIGTVSGTVNAVAKFTPDGISLGDSNITEDGTTTTFGVGAGATNMTLRADGGVTELAFDDDMEIESSDSISLIIADNDFIFAFDENFDTIYEIRDDPTSGALFRLMGDFNQGGATGANIVESFRIDPQGAPSGLTTGTWTGIQVNTGSGADHTGGNIRGIEIAANSPDVDTQEDGLTIQSGWDRGIVFSGSVLEIATTAGDLDILAAGSVDIDATATGQLEFGGQLIVQQAVPVAGAGGDSIALTGTLNAMDGSDAITGVVVGLTNANHTGAGNTLYGVEIAGITADADATEEALNIGAGWDVGISLVNDVPIQIGGAGRTLTGTEPFASDIELINTTSGGGITIQSTTDDGNVALESLGSGGTVEMEGEGNSITISATSMNLSVGDADNINVAEMGFSMLVDSDGSAADNPPTNRMRLYIDESTDRVATATADCALVGRLSDGTELNIAILVIDGGCP